MKILFATHGYKPAFRLGGPIISVSALAEQLVRKGHEVTVVTTNANLEEDLNVPLNEGIDVEGVKVRYFKRKELLSKLFPFIPYLSNASGYVYAPQMKRYLEENIASFDLVHTHLPFIYPTYVVGRFAKKYGRPLFYHQRGVLDPRRLEFRSLKKKVYMRAIELPILREAAMLFALTQVEAESYRGLGVNTPCRIIPNGIDTSEYYTRFIREVPGIPSKAQVILFMGRIHPIKGADKLLEAFIRIHERIPEGILVMAGPDEFGLEAKFIQKVHESNLSGKVLFPGMISGSLKKDLLARANIFCLPSAAEGFSMAVLEALASATPVLISPGCNFQEIETVRAGVVVDNNVDSIAKRLLALLEKPRELEEMGTRGRELVLRDYSWDRIADAVIDAYREGLGRYNSQGRYR